MRASKARARRAARHDLGTSLQALLPSFHAFVFSVMLTFLPFMLSFLHFMLSFLLFMLSSLLFLLALLRSVLAVLLSTYAQQRMSAKLKVRERRRRR
eukprot:356649-Pleurochrysis_carterae.AAC.1